jgi:hypothetical protein
MNLKASIISSGSKFPEIVSVMNANQDVAGCIENKKNAAWAFLKLRVKIKGGSISCNSVLQEKYFVSR